jgi:hypothetical protein
MPLVFIWFYKHNMAETKITKKDRSFSFVNNSYSYWQNSTKFHAKVYYTYLNNILKFFNILWTSTIFLPTVPFDPVSRYTPVSPTSRGNFTFQITIYLLKIKFFFNVRFSRKLILKLITWTLLKISKNARILGGSLSFHSITYKLC